MTDSNVTTPKETATEANQTGVQTKPPANIPRPTQVPPEPATPVKQEAAAEAMPALEKEAAEPSGPVRPEIRPHAFVVMPFGTKKGGDGSVYNFNAIYKTLIKPALEEAGFEPFRADEETTSGDILTDMFQELLLADLCLCDLSIDNANVYYELGIRHAFRKRGVVHIQAGRSYMPFDIFNVRTLPYHITAEGIPDPAFIKADIQAIARMARDTWASDHDSIHSPIFNLLSGLKEPERKTLRTPLATGFWREYNEWKEKVTVAQRKKRIGDILLLTEEIQNPLIKEEAIGEAGMALKNMGRNELALAQYRKGLEVNSGNLAFRREEAFNLNRLGRVDEAIVKIEGLLNDYPNDSEAISYLGRIYKEMWADSWKNINDKNKRMKCAFDSYHWLIKAVEIYLKGFHIDLNNYYPGVNALTLSTIALHLADKYDNKEDPDPDITRMRREVPELRGTLVFGLEAKAEDDKVDYWTLISLAELRVLTADNIASVVRSYRKALTASRRNLFFLNSSLAQLEILKALGLREEFVQAGMNTIQDEIVRVNGEPAAHSSKTKASSKKPKIEGQVFLFTGYMVDSPSKEKKTFPPDRETEVRNEIIKKLEKFNAGENDLAFTGGLSAGGEIIFAEICAEKGIHVEVHLPLPEAAYIREFVSPGGDKWVERFYKIRNHPLVDEMYQLDNVGAPKGGDDPYERNNRWALYSSLKRGIDKVRLIALWNGLGSRPKDRDAHLIRHMVELMRETGGVVETINTSKFIHNFIGNAPDHSIGASPAPTRPATVKATAARKSGRNK
ncbi:MAG: TRAFs-binding domain-containing protein [Anaerolineales bacterium]|nr:TRAFs-binding domain-containing protein [Anaerolineales bacterium]